MTKWIAGLALSGALAFAAPSTAEAQGPIVTGGLVNVTIVDVIDGDVLSNFDVALGVALNLAANVCNVEVTALVIDLNEGDDVATCTARNGKQEIIITQEDA